MATFVIKEAKKDSIYVVVTKNNGDTFGQTIRASQLEDGDINSLLKQIKGIVRETIRGQRKPNLNDLDSQLDLPQDDAEEVIPPA
jgi:hypothetical protein